MNEIYALDISTVFNHKTYLAYLPQAYRESVPYDTLLPMLPVLVTKFVRMEGDSVDLIFKANGRPLQLGGNASQFGTIKSDGVTLTTSAELVVLSLVKDLGITFDLSKLTRLGVEVICAEQSYHTERQITPALLDAYKQITYPVDPAQAVADLEPRFIQISADVEDISEEIDNAEEQLSETSPNLIKNRAVYNQYMDDKDIEDVILSVDPDFYKEQYLTLDIISDGNIIWSSYNPQGIKYSKNDGDWTTFNPGDTLSVITGDKVRFKGSIISTQYGFFGSTCSFNAYGNIMSLVGEDNFKDLETLTNTNQFFGLFTNTTLIDASNLILPATALSENCYEGMFYGCQSLTGAPKLPAVALAKNCYTQMFMYCTSLVNAPELPATILAERCYSQMFQNCTSLVVAPDLLAEVFVTACYKGMFRDCSSLNYIKCLGKTVATGATDVTGTWVTNVAANGTFVKATSYTGWPTGNSGIPAGWTVEEI